MAIVDTIVSMQSNLSYAYDAVNSKGGTLPANKNLQNLSTAINSITTSSPQEKIESTIPVLEKSMPDTWENTSWSGLSSTYISVLNPFDSIWTDGTDIYFSNGAQYVLNKGTQTWSAKTWTGTGDFSGNHENHLMARNIWTDGTDVYFTFYDEDVANDYVSYVLNKSTSTWTPVTFIGFPYFDDRNSIWTDGTNVYCSNGSTQYVLDKSNRTWSVKTWTGLTNFYGYYVWTDGTDIYYSSSNTHYKLNKATSTWTPVTWTGLTNFYGTSVWTDGDNIYYSNGNKQYYYDKTNMNWVAKTWYFGNSSVDGDYIWTDGSRIYCSDGTDQQVLIQKQICFKPTIK